LFLSFAPTGKKVRNLRERLLLNRVYLKPAHFKVAAIAATQIQRQGPIMSISTSQAQAWNLELKLEAKLHSPRAMGVYRVQE